MPQVKTWGNRLGISKALAIKLGLEAGSENDLDAGDDYPVIKPRAEILKDQLSKISPDHLHPEIQTGEMQGRESW